jgi:serine protease AprX
MITGTLKKNLTLLLLMLAVAGVGHAQPDPAKLTPGLTAEITAQKDLPVWVHFSDKGLSGAELESALAGTSARLQDKVRLRRAKSMTGQLLVDQADLPLSADYLAAVTATGARQRQVSRWLNAASFTASSEQIERISRLPFVTRIDLVGGGRPSRTMPQDSPPAVAEAIIAAARADKNLDVYRYGASYPGLTQANLPAAHAAGLTGHGVTVALLDTGFELDHECFQDLDVVDTWDFVNGDSDVGNGHDEDPNQALYGTGSLSILAGYSPNNLIGAAYGASVILAKTEDLDSETPVEEDNWIAAVEWAEGLGADIISSSLGYIDWYDFSQLDGHTTRITVAAEMAASRGVLVVNSSGDQRSNPEWSHIVPPADGRNVLAVGSIDLFNQVYFNCSPGPTADGRIKPNVMALGVGTAMAMYRTQDLYSFGYGTSYAMAMVAGAAALILEKSPNLNPSQIIEAFQETASRAILPDNDYGWGTINTLAAASYWAPVITHDPLPSVEPGSGSFLVQADITSTAGLDTDNIWIAWRRAGSSWNMTPLTHEQGAAFAGTIPAQPGGVVIEYYLMAQDLNGLSGRSPQGAPQALHTFSVATDTEGPQVFHLPLGDQGVDSWAPVLRAEATDNLGVASLSVRYWIHGGPPQGPFPMEKVGDHWELPFPWPYPVIPDLKFYYMITAQDTAEVPNFTILGTYTFSVVQSKGKVLVVDDRDNTKAAGDGRRAHSEPDSAPDKSANDLALWLTEAGFECDVIQGDAVGSSSFQGYDAVLISCGANFHPLGYTELRRTMERWAENGGKIMVEGGEVAYASSENPGYPEIMEKVLHIDSYQGENASTLRPPEELRLHPLVQRPNLLPVPLIINDSNGNDWGATDLVLVADDAFVAMQAGFGSTRGGIIAHDENTCPDAGQTIYLPFNLAKLVEQDARLVLDNAMSYLLFNEPPGSSSISGRVTLVGETDHSGVTVFAGPDHSAITAADGSYTIEGLWGGSYLVTADAEGFAPDTRTVDLVDEMNYPSVNLYLMPVVEVTYPDAPAAPIPDNDSQGVSRAVTVAEEGEVFGVSIDCDISHFSVGQLVITLTSPAGTSVTLHNRTGGTQDDLVGTWPSTLFVDGPGTLEDFLGEEAQGPWTLKVVDAQFGATGTLNSWALNLQIKTGSFAPVEDVPGPATRLLGNSPNPFNPRTEISFELAAAGQVQVDIYDVKGRLVQSLARGIFPAGRHTLKWSGKDDRGADQASGVYFCRFRSSDVAQVQKMMLVR